jgi:hypothetical protein
MKRQVRTAVIAAAIGVSAAAATVAVAGTGVGGVFNLGQTNSVDATTRLQGAATGGAQLAVTNASSAGSALGLNVTNSSAGSPAVMATNTGAGTGVQGTSATGFGVQAQTGSTSLPALRATNTGGFPAASFVTNPGAAPFRVNTSAKVVNLNADKLDGVDSSQFVQAGTEVPTTPAEPVRLDLGTLTIPTGSTSISQTVYSVPDGKDLVITYASGYFAKSFSDTSALQPRYELITFDGHETFYAPLPVSANQSFYGWATPLMSVAQTSVGVAAARDNSTNSAFTHIVITGYLVDEPPAPAQPAAPKGASSPAIDH